VVLVVAVVRPLYRGVDDAMSEQVMATAISWVIMFVWIGVVTYFIDMVGVMMRWWTNETFIGKPKDTTRPGQR